MALTKIKADGLTADLIDETKLADNSIDSEHYNDGSIDNAHLADDAVGVAELSATGTASSSTFLRGDNSWAAVTSTTINNNADNRVITGSGTANTLNGESTVVVDANGNLGIGTTSPSSTLSVEQSSSNVSADLHATGSGRGSQIKFHNDHGLAYIGQGGDTSGDFIIFNSTGSNLKFYTNDIEHMRINVNGYVTKPNNPIFHAFGGPSNVAATNDIVFGQERFDVGSGYNTSTGEYTAPATGYYHFYGQVYRQTDEGDSHWGFYIDTGSGYSMISESRMQNSYGGDSGRGYATLQLSIYWYMTAGHKIKCRVGNSSGDIHCNNTLSYFCGNLVG